MTNDFQRLVGGKKPLTAMGDRSKSADQLKEYSRDKGVGLKIQMLK